MRVIIINELLTMGGTEVQSKREKKFLEEKGHEVLYLTFDPRFHDGWDREMDGHYNFVTKHNKLQAKLFLLFQDKKLRAKLDRIIHEYNPDYIHVNNTTEHAIVILKAVANMKCFQTIRDYSAVCPTGLCVDKENKICTGTECRKCIKKCMPENHKLKFMYRLLVHKHVNKIRKKYIQQFACPSQTLTDYCNRYKMRTKCINNPFDFSILDEFEKNSIEDKKIYLFYGLVAKHKGIIQLMDAFTKFAEGKNVELQIAGKIDSGIEDILNMYLKNDKISYLGILPYQQIISTLRNVYAVVVPSLWIENYPNTALEGLATKCIVLGSNRGGTKELISNDNFVFDVMNEDDIIEKLDKSFYLTSDEYNEIIIKNMDRLKKNNSMEKYYERYIELFKSLM